MVNLLPTTRLALSILKRKRPSVDKPLRIWAPPEFYGIFCSILSFEFLIKFNGKFRSLRVRIRKQISPPKNPSSGWISIKKSKSRFHGFPLYRSIGKSEKGFAKLFSWTVVFFLLSMRARARPLFLRTVFQILFRISQSNSKNENPKTRGGRGGKLLPIHSLKVAP